MMIGSITASSTGSAGIVPSDLESMYRIRGNILDIREECKILTPFDIWREVVREYEDAVAIRSEPIFNPKQTQKYLNLQWIQRIGTLLDTLRSQRCFHNRVDAGMFNNILRHIHGAEPRKIQPLWVKHVSHDSPSQTDQQIKFLEDLITDIRVRIHAILGKKNPPPEVVSVMCHRYGLFSFWVREYSTEEQIAAGNELFPNIALTL